MRVISNGAAVAAQLRLCTGKAYLAMAKSRSILVDDQTPRSVVTATKRPITSNSARTPKLLLITRDINTAEKLTESLTGYFGPQAAHLSSCATEALKHHLKQYDLVLIDGSQSGETAIHQLSTLLDHYPELSVVIILPQDALDLTKQALRLGACDCFPAIVGYATAAPMLVFKHLEMSTTKPALQHSALERARFRNRRLQKTVQRLRALTRTDPLTSLDNRRSLTRVLRSSFAQATRYGQDLACLMVDLDDFKRYNDSLGHQAGDELLQRAARVIQANCRRADLAGRYGGDEFLVILPQTDLETAEQVGKRIRRAFESEMRNNTRAVTAGVIVTMSLGVATLHHSECASAPQLVSCADRALYSSKKNGKSRLSVYHSDTATSAA